MKDKENDWEAMECPRCKEIALECIHHGSDYDEWECTECRFYMTTGRNDD